MKAVLGGYGEDFGVAEEQALVDVGVVVAAEFVDGPYGGHLKLAALKVGDGVGINGVDEEVEGNGIGAGDMDALWDGKIRA